MQETESLYGGQICVPACLSQVVSNQEALAQALVDVQNRLETEDEQELVFMAQDPDKDITTLLALVQMQIPDVNLALSDNPAIYTDAELLQELFAQGCWQVKQNIAKNKGIFEYIELLHIFSGNSNFRIGLALNNSIIDHPGLVFRLVKDEDEQVREALAGNLGIAQYPNILGELRDDEEFLVRQAAEETMRATKKISSEYLIAGGEDNDALDIPQGTKEILFGDDFGALTKLALNARDQLVLGILVQNNNRKVQFSLAKNPNITEDMALSLIENSEIVRGMIFLSLTKNKSIAKFPKVMQNILLTDEDFMLAQLMENLIFILDNPDLYSAQELENAEVFLTMAGKRIEELKTKKH